MATQYLEAAPVDETLERAKTVSFARFVQTMIFGAFYVLGWIAGRIFLGMVYCALAVAEGWRDGAGRPRSEAPKHAKTG